MASDQNYVDYICEQAGLADALTYRKMFGEYALYLDGKVVGFICDNVLFLKPTDESRAELGAVTEGIPYPKAKPYFRIGEEIDDRALLRRVLVATARALPAAKLKRPGASKAASAKARFGNAGK